MLHVEAHVPLCVLIMALNAFYVSFQEEEEENKGGRRGEGKYEVTVKPRAEHVSTGVPAGSLCVCWCHDMSWAESALGGLGGL